MLRINAMRMMVPEAQAADFEPQIREQLRRVREDEPGTMLYGFCRRESEGSTILPAPRPGSVEYFHFMAFNDEAGWDAHFAAEQDWWVPTFRKALDGPILAERFDAGDVVAGITRDHVWDPQTLHRFAVFRFKIAEERAVEFEEQAARQVASVRDNEPGTVLYTFFRRKPAAGGLLPRPVNGQAEYFHYMAYDSEEAQNLHREIEFRTEGWAWGPVFREFLVAPLESESFGSDRIVAGVTRAAWW